MSGIILLVMSPRTPPGQTREQIFKFVRTGYWTAFRRRSGRYRTHSAFEPCKRCRLIWSASLRKVGWRSIKEKPEAIPFQRAHRRGRLRFSSPCWAVYRRVISTRRSRTVKGTSRSSSGEQSYREHVYLKRAPRPITTTPQAREPSLPSAFVVKV